MTQEGSEWPKCGYNVPSALGTYLMYLYEARAVRNGYHIFEGRSNMYVLYFVTDTWLYGPARYKMVYRRRRLGQSSLLRRTLLS